MLTTTIISLILNTGGISSPFIPLLILSIVFADVFGLWGVIPIVLLIATITIYQFVVNEISTELFIIIGFSTLLPLIISIIIWHNRAKEAKLNVDNSKSYRNLATELNEVASKSEVVINAIGDGVIAIDNNGIIQLINPAAQIITGWSREDALALNYKSVIQLVNMKNESIDGADNPISQAINTNTEFRTSNLTLVTKNDKKIMVSLVASPVSATASGVIVVFRDITKEKAEEREQAEYSVYLDKDHVREVIENIIENAIKYTPKGEVMIDVNGDDDHVIVSIKDSGIGIPSEDMPHLFQKFYRVENKDSNYIGGTGLGLYLSRRLVEMMGGRIWAESKVKVGSTFYIELPRINNQDVTNIENQKQFQPTQEAQSNETAKPAKSVPRGESLTPEQIAEYVAKQRLLAHQENAPDEVAGTAQPAQKTIPISEPEGTNDAPR